MEGGDAELHEELETFEQGLWAVRAVVYGEGHLYIGKVITDQGDVTWEALPEPEITDYDTARKTAMEYVQHVTDVQDPECRDRVFVQNLPLGSIVPIILE